MFGKSSLGESPLLGSDAGAEDCKGRQSDCQLYLLIRGGVWIPQKCGRCGWLAALKEQELGPHPHCPYSPKTGPKWLPSLAPWVTWQLPDLSAQGWDTSD